MCQFQNITSIYASINHSQYWMPIHYDNIKDGQNKKAETRKQEQKSHHLYFLKTWYVTYHGKQSHANVCFV